MKSILRRLLAVPILILALSPGLSAQDEAEGKIIKRIEIEGNRRIHKRRVRPAIKSRVGEAYRSELVDQDVGRIWALGYFDNIRVKTEPEADGVRLIFVLTERPTISKIVFLGNKAIDGKTLTEKTSLKEGSFVSPYTLVAAKREIIEQYRQKGYQFVEVQYKREEKDGRVEVTFVISEGPKLRIHGLSFRGNKAFKSRLLRGKMQTKKRFWPFADGIYDEHVLQSDLDVLRDYYRSKGWLDVQVGRELSYNDKKTKLYITVFIEEGDRYHVASLTIKGNELFTKEEIRRRVKLVPGAPFVREDFDRDRKAVRGLYGEQGFIDTRVRAQTPLSAEPAKINVIYNVVEGERVYVERIDIRGNEKTKDHVIRRQLTYYPGERFNTTKIRESKARVFNTRLFESYDPIASGPPVDTDTEPGPDPQHRVSVVKVREGRTGQLSFGAGISSNVGFIGQVSITQSNFDALDLPTSVDDFLSGNAFIGGGQTLSLNAQPGTKRSEYSLSFREPSAFDSPYGFGTSAYMYQREREDYDEDRLGGDLTVDRRLTKHLRVGVTYADQKIGIRNVDDRWASEAVREVEGTTNRFSTAVRGIYDTRDNYLYTTKGMKIEPGVELAGTIFGGDVDLVKLSLGMKSYFKVFDVPKWGPHVLSLGLEVGVVDSLRGEDVPIFDRYFAGGPGGSASLRGFSFRGVGPVDPTTREPVGGEIRVLNTVEYVFPLMPGSQTIRGVGFVDAGTVGERIHDMGPMRVSAGFGLRLTFPQLGYIPIDLDWGIPIASEATDDEQVFSFNIGGGLRF